MIHAEKASPNNIDPSNIDHDHEAEVDHGVITVGRMAELLGVSRSGYYAWASRRDAEPGPRAARRDELLIKIEGFHQASDGVNGAPRILRHKPLNRCPRNGVNPKRPSLSCTT